MRGTICFLLLSCILPLQSQIMFKVFKDTLIVFKHTGGDEFNSGKLDEAVWKNGIGGRRVLMVQDLAFVPENVKFEEGLINFVANRRDTTFTLNQSEVDSNYLRKRNMRLNNNKFTTLYTTGAIVSRKKFHYGMYELRFKVEEGKGVWPAFWFYGGNKNEEIDCFELKGERNNEIHVDAHCPSGCAHGYHKTRFSFPGSYGGWMPVSNHLHEGFNIMLFEWKENELIWYINGFPLAYYRGSFSNPMSLFLNTSVAKTGEAFSPGPDESTRWPNNYYVDYLRIWQEEKSVNINELKVNKEFTYSTKYPSDYYTKAEKKKGLMYRKKVLGPVDGVIVISRPSTQKLVFKILGRLADESTEINIKGNKTSTSIKASNAEIEVTVDPSDKELLIEFRNSCRPFKQRVILSE